VRESKERGKASPVEECDCKEGIFNGLSRRGLFSASVALAGGAFATRAKAKAPAGAFEYRVQEDPTEEQGRTILDDGGYGSSSQEGFSLKTLIVYIDEHRLDLSAVTRRFAKETLPDRGPRLAVKDGVALSA